MGQTCMLLGSHGTCMATAASCRGHMQVHKPWDVDMLGPREQMPRRGVRGRLGSRNFVWLGPELGTWVRRGSGAQAGCLCSALIPPYLPFRDHVFSFDLQAQEEGEGLVPNKVRGCMRGGAGRESKLGKV